MKSCCSIFPVLAVLAATWAGCADAPDDSPAPRARLFGAGVEIPRADPTLPGGFACGLRTELLLRPDGTWESTGLEPRRVARGHWRRSEGRVNCRVEEEAEDPGLDWTAEIDWKPAGGLFAFAIVRWGDRTYLVSQDQMRMFLADAREGREPRRALPGTGYLLAWGDETREATGEPKVPDWARRDLASVAGEYYLGNGLGMNVSYSLKPDGTWEWECAGCTGVSGQERGCWRERDGVAILDTTETNRNVGAWDNPPDWRPDTGTRTFAILRWGERCYLVGHSQWLDFVNEVNQGGEPRSEMHGFILLRRGDDSLQVHGPPPVPDEWKPWILPEPLHGEILELLDDGLAVASLGARDGVRKGMVFTVRSAKGRGWKSIQSRVVSVQEDRCVLKHEYDHAQEAYEAGMAVSSLFFER